VWFGKWLKMSYAHMPKATGFGGGGGGGLTGAFFAVDSFLPAVELPCACDGMGTGV
jgi:hypothetical protein